jgi:hypothetical protein
VAIETYEHRVNPHIEEALAAVTLAMAGATAGSAPA